MIVILTSETCGHFKCPVSQTTVSGIAKVFGYNGMFYILSGVVSSGEVYFSRASIVKKPGHYIFIVYSVLDNDKIFAENVYDLLVIKDEV